MQRYVADLGRSWLVLVVCAGVAPFLLGFVFLILMRFLAGLMTWLFIVCVNLLLIAVTLYTYAKGRGSSILFVLFVCVTRRFGASPGDYYFSG
jgi:hypothetical protein